RGASLARLVWLTRDGRVEPILPQPRSFAFARLSPDERRIAVIVVDNRKSDAWIYDIGQGTFSRLTTTGTVTSVDWTPDGSQVVFTTLGESSEIEVWSRPATGGTEARQLLKHGGGTVTVAVSPDGKSLLLTAIPRLDWDVYRVSLDSAPVARPYLATGAHERAPRFSPDGHWVALTSDESGQDEIYVRSYPDPSSRIQISVGGGSEATWSRDGSLVYYRSGRALLAARVSRSSGFTLVGRDTVIGMAGTLSDFTGVQNGDFSGAYQPSRDGRRFLAILSDRNEFQLVVSPNWITELRRRVAEAGARP
ncbi:MAG TPA: hypothetical protein VM070_07445, partial [Candidatus Saccharimonadales bacterium]|nr:hypothetical protein [Candidatus Saccharimonadales bacterium]